MPTTATYLLPYPAAGDPADVPTDMQELADRLETVLPTVGASLVTALPGSPINGQEVILVDSLSAPTYSWHLKYVAAKASNKWISVGGGSAAVKIATAEGTASTTYAALTTPGPSFTIPVAGDYLITQGARVTVGAASSAWHMSYDIGGTGAVDLDALAGFVTTGAQITASSRENLKTLTAVALVSKYKTVASTATFAERLLLVTPVAVGG